MNAAFPSPWPTDTVFAIDITPVAQAVVNLPDFAGDVGVRLGRGVGSGLMNVAMFEHATLPPATLSGGLPAALAFYGVADLSPAATPAPIATPSQRRAEVGSHTNAIDAATAGAQHVTRHAVQSGGTPKAQLASEVRRDGPLHDDHVDHLPRSRHKSTRQVDARALVRRAAPPAPPSRPTGRQLVHVRERAIVRDLLLEPALHDLARPRRALELVDRPVPAQDRHLTTSPRRLDLGQLHWHQDRMASSRPARRIRTATSPSILIRASTVCRSR